MGRPPGVWLGATRYIYELHQLHRVALDDADMNYWTPETLSGVRPELLQKRAELMGLVPAQFAQQIALGLLLQARPFLTALRPAGVRTASRVRRSRGSG